MNVTTHNMMAERLMPRHWAAARYGGLAASIVHTLDVWRTRIRDRRTIAALDRRDLLDLNLSRWEVESELAKPFWRG